MDTKFEVELPQHIESLFDLSGKVALVSTAASGLGRAIAYGMARYGADVVCADLDLSGAEDTASQIRQWGKEGIAIPYDVRDWFQVKKMIRQSVDHF
ncbi:MAG: SDR family NAD(P)-dependent oxidoreductase, partial [Deltaproteobacteria bacterium]|nr:SDR family NAD(P)-dependent oxidoreductase [Deltaproteobacteria bacterium]